jgi:hypothetical protein
MAKKNSNKIEEKLVVEVVTNEVVEQISVAKTEEVVQAIIPEGIKVPDFSKMIKRKKNRIFNDISRIKGESDFILKLLSHELTTEEAIIYLLLSGRSKEQIKNIFEKVKVVEPEEVKEGEEK